MILSEKHIICLLFFLLFVLISVFPQQLIEESRIDLRLPDSTFVSFFSTENTGGRQTPCYYLPVNLRISQRDDNPEFSFLAYDTDSDGQTDGAIMHMLFTWGLTREQSEQAEYFLKNEVDSSLTIFGAVQIHAKPDDDFLIYGDSDLDEILLNSITSRGGIPKTPGGKMAISFMFSAENAWRMEKALQSKESLSKIYFQLNFEYSVLRKNGLIKSSQLQKISLRKTLSDLIGNQL
jgi:hypothetical protein